MRSCIIATIAAATVLLPLSTAAADDNLSREQLVKVGKPATALVECVYARGRAYGSAFCVHSSGLFATNAHVVTSPGIGYGEPNITLVVDPALKSQRVLRARVVRIDKEKDLALLRADGVADLPTLSVGSVEGIVETSELIAFGFPFGTQLSETKVDYPAVSVNIGTVTSLRHKMGALNRIQVDAVLNPGNSGGPALSRDGKVIGVVVSGVKGSQVNFLIPANQLQEFLASPTLEFKVPAVAVENRHREVVFESRAASLLPGGKSFSLELILKSDDGKERRFPMEGNDGVYRASAAPILPPVGPSPLRVVVNYANGSINGKVVDRLVKVGDRELMLGTIRSFRRLPMPQVEMIDGKSIEGTIASADLEMPLGSDTVRLKLADAVSMTVESEMPHTVITCTVIARQGATEVGRLSDTLTFAAKKAPSQPDASAGRRPLPPPDVPGKTTVDLVSLIDAKRDAMNNRRWEVVDDELRCLDTHFVPRLQIPYQPPEEYDFIVTFSQPNLRNGIALIMPHPKGGSSFFWHMGSERGANYGFFSNPDKVGSLPGLLKPNAVCSTTVQVRRDRVRAFVDGKQMVETNYDTLGCDHWHAINDKTLLALSCDEPTVFHYVRVIEISGAGKKTR